MPSTAYARGLVNGAIEVAWWRYRLGRAVLLLPLPAIEERRQALRQLFLIRRALADQPSSGCICTVPGYMPDVDCRYPHTEPQP